MSKIFTTPKGTELPVSALKGKDYLEVKYRLVWFREERSNWTIDTSLISVSEKSALAKAEVRDESGRIISTGHKSETVQGFADFIEKAETGAIGRALAHCGFGTQFCGDELDEGERLADSPVDNSHKSGPRPLNASPKDVSAGGNPGNYRITFGKYSGRQIMEINSKDLKNYVEFLESKGNPKGDAWSFVCQAKEYLKNLPQENPEDAAGF